ncbi:hypothetical protein SAMN04515666_12027 [Bosea lupini]|uniref:PhnA-like protein n=1 Tax=Bosea lupini TaxID=1036779 RepID=A0A1H8ANZ0_9HYPH|nr:hypothetical protein [Bosea lupini]SEM71538.1 hypothetical protein SAMN04515666_12027 [Bosea lupini]
MASETTDVVVVAPTQTAPHSGSYLEWGAIFGGATLSAAITTLLTTFGSAIGLSLVSFEPSRSTGLTALAIAGALWALWVSVMASAAGGYLAGRMRRPAADASQHERHVRDGSHGLVVWAVGALLIAGLAASSVAGLAKTAASGAAAVTSAAGTALSQQPDPLSVAADTVTRSTGTAPVTQAERDEASRILVRSLASGQLDPADRSYIASRMAARMNIAQPEAEKRIDDAVARLNQAKESAKQAAERARKVGVLSAFLTAAALLVGAAAAWMAAQLGGKHRDEELDLSALWGRRGA